MNYLAHLHLGQIASNDPLMMVGNMMGDFVKGRIPGHYSPVLQQAIRHHRSIDAFTDSHRSVIHCKALFKKPFRRYAGVIVDLCFDHLLCKHWQVYADGSLEDFIDLSYRLLLKHRACLPGALESILPRMIAADFLGSYRTLEGIAMAMQRIGERMKRPLMLEGAMPQLREHYVLMEYYFNDFYPQLMQFSRDAIEHESNSFSDVANKRVE